MIQRLLAAAVIAFFISSPALADVADCGFPPTVSPKIPDGTNASREEIMAAAEAVKVYGKAVNAFLDCHKPDLLLNHLVNKENNLCNTSP